MRKCISPSVASNAARSEIQITDFKKKTSSGLNWRLHIVMYQAWLWWAWAFKIVSQARIEGLPKPRAWLGLKPRLVYHIWLLLQKALKCVAE
jgi:hypothetical protein